MANPQIKTLLILAGISIIYAFVCEIGISRKASRLAARLKKVRPDLWSALNFMARNWNGGYPGLKILYRKNVVRLPWFDQEFEQIHSMERKFLWGIGIGSACIAVLLIGFKFGGWHW